jgi:ribonucleoside-triphosphate reductase
MIITDKFANKYKNKQPNWGFNGLGYIVYKRTYSRLKENGETEEWYETVQRCINGAQDIGADYTQEEAEKLYDLIFNFKCNFAGRMLWQLGTPTVKRWGANSLLNCLRGTTRVLTRQGWKEIHTLVDKTVEIVTKNGKWVNAPFKSYGKQNLMKVVFEDRYGNIEEVYATKNHRWFYLDKNHNSIETTTEELQTGVKIPVIRGKNSSKGLSPQGIQHGLVFGDGSCNGYESFVDLIDNTYDECANYFNLNRISWTNPDNSRHVRYGGMPNYYKSLPNINENKQYLSGFLAGWIAADGSVNKSNGRIRLFNRDKEVLMFAKDVAAVLGYRTSEPYLERDHNPFDLDDESCELWSITFYTSDNPHHLIIRKDHLSKLNDFDRDYNNWTKVIKVETTDLNEEVFCAEVPETHSFVIQGNILTGNCWAVAMREPKAFLFLFENLMLGGGVGYSIRREDVHELPKIKVDVTVSHQYTKDADLIVPDSREGWVKLLENVLNAYYVTGKSFSYSTILIRGAGEPIHGFGGKASGPAILVEGISKIGSIFKSREGKKLRSIDVLDICNIIGSVVVAGNVRRSAEIALGDPDDILYLRAKNWSSGNVPNWRGMSNNTIYADDFDHIMNEIWENGYILDKETGMAKGEPYGFFNLPLSQKFGRIKDGPIKDNKMYPTNVDNCEMTNPCAEISLSNYECCNLCELYLNNIENKEELIDCAKLLYKTQKAISALPFIHEETNKIVHKNMRLGLGVTGICQSLDKVDWLDDCYVALRKLDKQWSKEKGHPESIKLTTIKPSGTLSLLGGATPGVHPAYSQYYFRTVRMASSDKLVQICKDLGYHTEYLLNFDGSEDRGTVVVYFPCETPSNAILAKDMDVIKQLDMVKKLQNIWSDNAVSVTAYYKEAELPALKNWLSDNYKNHVKSVSFLLHKKHGFKQAPYQEIDKETYDKAKSLVKSLNNIKIGGGEIIQGLECEGGACPIR